MRWLGLDIGGANIKAADALGFATNEAFCLWREPQRLARAIANLLNRSPPFERMAVTMTGELADCFATREAGVCGILDQLTSVVAAPLVRVYTVEGQWMSVSEAARNPWLVAASNWHALAQLVLRWTDYQPSLLIDVGSTTTDVIPLIENRIATDSKIDSQRLQRGELIYAGVERTPVCGLVRELPLFGNSCPIMNEWFATTEDAYIWLSLLEEQADSLETADGRPKTKAFAAARLARLVGEDQSTLGATDLSLIAQSVFLAQATQMAAAIDRQRSMLGKEVCKQVFLSGHGDFLIDAALNHLGWQPMRVSLAEKLGQVVSRCAPAHAVAVLANEQLLPTVTAEKLG